MKQRQFYTWQEITRGDSIETKTIPRLEQPLFVQECCQWVLARFPEVDDVFIHVMISDEVTPEVDRVVLSGDDDWLGFSVQLFITVPPVPEDELGEQVYFVRYLEKALNLAVDAVGLSTPAPMVTLTAEELDWVATHGEPHIPISSIVFRDEVRHGEPSTVREDIRFEPFDIWDLFPGDVEDPVNEFQVRFEKLTDARRGDARAAINNELDNWFEARSSVSHCFRTDSGLMTAVASLLDGPDGWRRNMTRLDLVIEPTEELYDLVILLQDD